MAAERAKSPRADERAVRRRIRLRQSPSSGESVPLITWGARDHPGGAQDPVPDARLARFIDALAEAVAASVAKRLGIETRKEPR